MIIAIKQKGRYVKEIPVPQGVDYRDILQAIQAAGLKADCFHGDSIPIGKGRNSNNTTPGIKRLSPFQRDLIDESPSPLPRGDREKQKVLLALTKHFGEGFTRDIVRKMNTLATKEGR